MKSSIKRAFAIVLSCAMASLGISACSHEKDPKSPNDDKPSSALSSSQPTSKPLNTENAAPFETPVAATPEATEGPEEKDVIIYRVHSVDNYNDGIARVSFSKVSRTISSTDVFETESETSFAYIDKNGKVLFKIPAGYSGEEFSNGYAYVHNENTLYVIDKSGNVLSNYAKEASDNEHVAAYADGYVLTLEKASTFSESKFIYRLYDPTGEVVNTHESAKKLSPFHYCGRGIFCASLYSDSNVLVLPHIYMTSNGKSFIGKDNEEGGVYYCPFDTLPSFRDSDTAAVCFEYHPNLQIVFIDVDGNFSTKGFPDGYKSEIIGNITENHMLMYRGDFRYVDKNLKIISVDLVNKKYAVLDKEYADKISALSATQLSVFHNGRYVFPLQGADGESYTGIFDEKLKPVCDPIPGTCSSIGFSCERLIISRTNGSESIAYIYDTDGNELFSVNSGNRSYSDSVLLAKAPADIPWDISEDGEIITTSSYTYVLYDVDGNILFEGIDFNTGTELVFE